MVCFGLSLCFFSLFFFFFGGGLCIGFLELLYGFLSFLGLVYELNNDAGHGWSFSFVGFGYLGLIW